MARVLVAVAAFAALAALLGAGRASAHVGVTPGVVSAGDEVELLVELPRLRPGAPPTALAVSGDGVRVLSTAGAGRAGAETRWRVRLVVDAAPGTVPLVLRASFADGRSVEVPASLTVVPRRGDGTSSTRSVAIGAALAAVGVGAAAFVLRRARRRDRE